MSCKAKSFRDYYYKSLGLEKLVTDVLIDHSLTAPHLLIRTEGS